MTWLQSALVLFGLFFLMGFFRTLSEELEGGDINWGTVFIMALLGALFCMIGLGLLLGAIFGIVALFTWAGTV